MDPYEPPTDLTVPSFDVPSAKHPCPRCGDDVAAGPPGVQCANCVSDAAFACWNARADTALADAYKSIPEEYRDASDRLSSIVGPNAIAEAAAARSARCVVVSGPSSSGKTRLAVAMLLAHLNAARTFPGVDRVTSGGAILERVGTSRYVRAYRLGRDREWDTNYRTADMLIVDDLGVEDDPPVITSTLVDVLFERVDCHRATVITTSLAMSAILARYGEGIARRLFQRHAGITLGARTR